LWQFAAMRGAGRACGAGVSEYGGQREHFHVLERGNSAIPAAASQRSPTAAPNAQTTTSAFSQFPELLATIPGSTIAWERYQLRGRGSLDLHETAFRKTQMKGDARAMPNQVGVIHLVRAANGLKTFELFLNSYGRYQAGQDHDLVLLLKGFQNQDQAEPYLTLARAHSPKPFHVSDSGLDLAAYGKAIRTLHYPVLCFLNSFSEILVGGWLRLLLEPLRDAETGLAGSTGSWESMRKDPGDTWQQMVHRSWATKLKWHWRQARRERDFPPFPNPHVRTNAFLARRSDLMRFWPRRLSTKRSAWKFESGKASLTRRFQEAGMKTVVVGADGRAFEPELWPRSGTFRHEDQNNLIVADNQTRRYAEADVATRVKLSELAWNDPSP
jgi:hypothetical protein